MSDLERVLRALRTMRPPLITQETDLHALVGECLAKHEIVFAPEVRLDPRHRIDFLTSDGTGIECKKGKPARSAVVAQLERYAEHERVRSLVLVTAWQRHLHLPPTIRSKPVEVVILNKLWGVAL